MTTKSKTLDTLKYWTKEYDRYHKEAFAEGDAKQSAYYHGQSVAFAFAAKLLAEELEAR